MTCEKEESCHPCWRPAKREGMTHRPNFLFALSYRDPSTFSEGDWRHCHVGLEGPVIPSETWIPIDVFGGIHLLFFFGSKFAERLAVAHKSMPWF